jgi:hypothetical protein
MPVRAIRDDAQEGEKTAAEGAIVVERGLPDPLL